MKTSRISKQHFIETLVHAVIDVGMRVCGSPQVIVRSARAGRGGRIDRQEHRQDHL
ncbi:MULTISPECIES: hypothetical protein [Rhodococcus]|uniref:hypothetical protein n=1 Tax=Rhodococcus TaxID=1827 RepID=UPI0012F6F8F0|nr:MULTISPECIES: hypothetical protein [Rhodococcus]